MTDLWYYTTGGSQYGPVPFARLRQMAAAGELGAADYVRHESQAEWVAAQNVANLFVPQPVAATARPPVVRRPAQPSPRAEPLPRAKAVPAVRAAMPPSSASPPVDAASPAPTDGGFALLSEPTAGVPSARTASRLSRGRTKSKSNYGLWGGISAVLLVLAIVARAVRGYMQVEETRKNTERHKADQERIQKALTPQRIDAPPSLPPTGPTRDVNEWVREEERMRRQRQLDDLRRQKQLDDLRPQRQ